MDYGIGAIVSQTLRSRLSLRRIERAGFGSSRCEQLLERKETPRDALLMRISHKGLQRAPVCRDAVRPKIFAENRAGASDIGIAPRQRIARHAGKFQPVKAVVLCLFESFQQV